MNSQRIPEACSIEGDCTYRVRNWEQIYENNRSRELKRLDWVPIPNRMDGDGYTELLAHPNGASHLGAWIAIVQIASRCEPRGTLQREGGRPHDAASLSRISRIPESVIKEALPRFLLIGWIEGVSVRDFNNLRAEAKKEPEKIPQEGATFPQDAAPTPTPSPHEGALNGREGNGTEGNTKPFSAANAAEEQRACLSLVDNPPPEITGHWIAGKHDEWYYGAYWNHKDREASRKAYAKRIKALMKDARPKLSAEEAVAFLWNSAIADKQRFESTEEWEWRQSLHPATWLNKQRWEDQPRTRSPSSNGRQRSFMADVAEVFGKNIQETGKPW